MAEYVYTGRFISMCIIAHPYILVTHYLEETIIQYTVKINRKLHISLSPNVVVKFYF